MPEPCPVTGPPRDTLQEVGFLWGSNGGLLEGRKSFYSDLLPHPCPSEFWASPKELVCNWEGLDRSPWPSSKQGDQGAKLGPGARVLTTGHWEKPEMQSPPCFQTSKCSSINFLERRWSSLTSHLFNSQFIPSGLTLPRHKVTRSYF